MLGSYSIRGTTTGTTTGTTFWDRSTGGEGLLYEKDGGGGLIDKWNKLHTTHINQCAQTNQQLIASNQREDTFPEAHFTFSARNLSITIQVPHTASSLINSSLTTREDPASYHEKSKCKFNILKTAVSMTEYPILNNSNPHCMLL